MIYFKDVAELYGNCIELIDKQKNRRTEEQKR